MYLSIKVLPDDRNVEVVQGFLDYTDVKVIGVCEYATYAHIPSRNIAASLAHMFGKLGIVTNVTISDDDFVSDHDADIIKKLLGDSWKSAALDSDQSWSRAYEPSTMKAYRWDSVNNQMWFDQCEKGHWEKIEKPYPEHLMFMTWVPVQEGDMLPRGG